MNLNGTDPLPAPKPATALHGGQNGEPTLPAGVLNRAMFADVIAARDAKPDPDQTTSPTPAPNADPEALVKNPPPQAEPANENLTEEEKAEAAAKAEAEAKADETDLSQTEDKALNEALAGLNDDGKKHLFEMVKAVETGEISLGELKRNWKLGRKENEELVKLRTENEQLRQAPPTVTTAANLPPTVAKLKSVEEVEARRDLCEQSIDALEDFLEKNPQGGAIGEQEFTREQIIDRKRAFRDELKVLPKQAQAIQQRQQHAQVQSENRKQVETDFPVLKDPENPVTKLAREFLKDPSIQRLAAPDYTALALARGHTELQKELASKVAGKVAAKPVARTGTVPAGKPHSAGSAPARTTNGSAPVGDLLKGVKDKKSFAELLAGTGR